ncbi:MAG: TIR domain-containing protein, partial [Bacteroidota bacterium]
MLKVFVDYDKDDEKFKDDLVEHLNRLVGLGLVEVATPDTVRAGDVRKQAIENKLRTADIIIFIVTKNMIGSDQMMEVHGKIAMEQYQKGKAKILPVYTNSCFYQGSFLEQVDTFLPEKGGSPIQNLSNPNDGWLKVVYGVLKTVAEITGKDPHGLVAQFNRNQKAVERKVMEEYNLQTPSGQVYINEKIAHLGIQKSMGRLQLVNMDRKNPRNSWWDAYDEKEEQLNIFQFYFLAACPNQMPPSFAERMVYELYQEKTEDAGAAFHYETNALTSRVKVRELPVKRNAKKTIEAFKKYICERFDFQYADFDFDKFVKEGIPRLNYDYVATVFQIHSADWEDHLQEFFEWIVATFSECNEELPTFVFFFVVYIDNAHLPHLLAENKKAIISTLADIAKVNDNTTVFKQLSP